MFRTTLLDLRMNLEITRNFLEGGDVVIFAGDHQTGLSGGRFGDARLKVAELLTLPQFRFVAGQRRGRNLCDSR